jgi:hypothetical protein
MKFNWRILCYLLPVLGFVFACSKTVDPSSSDPYPSLDQQRAALSNKPHVTPTRILDSVQIISDLEYLASDLCEGRKPGTAGHSLALNRVSSQMRAAQIDSFDNFYEHNFNGAVINGTTKVTNIVGWIRGTRFPDKYIVVTAHYDHLGKTANGEIYNGADDNASGVACLLALAKYFKNQPPTYSLVFAAVDREESGLFEGSNNLIYYLDSKFGIGKLVYNLNLDMIARSDNNEIFACGIHYYPAYKYLIDETQNKTNVKLLMGHDNGSSGDNWIKSSDHYAFYLVNIPFLYIGVEDHPDYHMPTDDVDKINYSKYIENCNMIALMLKAFKN